MEGILLPRALGGNRGHGMRMRMTGYRGRLVPHQRWARLETIFENNLLRVRASPGET